MYSSEELLFAYTDSLLLGSILAAICKLAYIRDLKLPANMILTVLSATLQAAEDLAHATVLLHTQSNLVSLPRAQFLSECLTFFC